MRTLSSFLLAACLLAAGLCGPSARAADYTLSLGPDATLGLWATWNVPANTYELLVQLEPDSPMPDSIRLFDLELSWDPSRLSAIGAPAPGTIFAGGGDPWFGHYDGSGTRTVTGVLLGQDQGTVPAGSVTLFSQLFHAIDPAGGPALIEVGEVSLRDPDNAPISVNAADEVLLTVDVTPPQSYSFDIVALVPAGNQAVSAQLEVASSLLPGDGSLARLVLDGTPAAPANASPLWQAPPAPSSYFLSPPDGPKSVYIHLRDEYGNRITLSDGITLNQAPPAYHVLDLEARPRHEGVLLTWQNPLAPDFDHVRIYRRGWLDSGLSGYPEYDDLAPMDPYPTDESSALSAGFTLVYSGTDESQLDPVLPRDVYRYVAFAVNTSLLTGPGHADARDRSTNYLLGDFFSPFDGLVFATDLVRLSNRYSTSEGDLLYDNQIDIGPTDDDSREGIPLTDNQVDFEDLMIFAMNYGPFGPASSSAPPNAKELYHTASRPVIRLVRDGTRLGVELEDAGETLGLHLRLAWDGSSEPVVVDCPGRAVIRQQDDGGLLLDRVFLPGESAKGTLLSLDFPGGLPAGLEAREIELRDTGNRRLSHSLEGAVSLPEAFQVEPARPNPFNPMTRIPLLLPEARPVEIALYNCLGERVRQESLGSMSAGRHLLPLDGAGLASGVYILHLQAGRESQHQRLLLMR